MAPEVVERALCDAQVLGEPATQEIPPATRRKVMRRDHGRCRVPGCRLATWVDVHHIQLRSEGGDHSEDNRLVLCESHHSAIHDGRLILEGSAASTRFLHADGTRYGAETAPSRNDAFADVFLAMKTMGCKEAIARKAIARVQPHAGPELPVEDLLRRCLVAMRQV